ncbi:peptide chain release factor N(5)-glutamine methyltransferase [Hydrocarboniphaga sp.]|uniref:peptide chain release factor N(5)-glutamine methyltransferase n=1 Tax=Hydrocarboniphaga sp. TaxID=2033016 RepID=UPI003D0EEFE3
MTIAEALIAGTRHLAPHSDTPRLDAELLLASVLKLSRGALFARTDELVDEDPAQRFDALVQRRADHEPIAYLLGTQGFWTLDLQVNGDVLVPRPETELLVEWAMEILARDKPVRVADLGTGSGAIALAIASERPLAQVSATDVSAAALRIAQANAQRHHLGNLRFAQGSWYTALDAGFDLIVSNPPYIAAGDAHLPALKHEPLDALSDHGDGLSCLRDIINGAPPHLLPDGWLLVEHGYDQGAAVRALFEQAGFVGVVTRRDLGRQERATGGRLA